jgi:S1-C subfamily serine protease
MKTLLLLLLCFPMIGFGQCIKGDCEDGHGTYIYTKDSLIDVPNGRWQFECRYRKKEIRDARFVYLKGDKYVGEFKDGRMDGQGKYISKHWEYVGEFKNGKKHGQGTETWSNDISNTKYVAEWKDGKLNGQGTMTWADGKYVGEFKDGVKIDWPSSFSDEHVRIFLDSKISLDNNEGIYRFQHSNPSVTSQYKLLILKDGYKYNGHIMSANCVGCQYWTAGDIKFEMIEGAVDGLFDVKWNYPHNWYQQKSSQKIFFSELDGALISNKDDLSLIKLYPKLGKKNKRVKNGEWAGNGSGIIISKSGYIITNHHVIDDADDIEVEFILDDEVQKFNAEIVQSDKVNDLAVIKIVDVNFDGVKELPYNFKTRSSDVGTKVYAFGYPMALSIMGKEVKVTDGIISSKTGFDGDITTYQISAPIQGGNSGGPLFDDKGNFIGINSSAINKKLADNVGYSIKTSYVLNLIDILPKSIDLPSNKKLASLPHTEQIKEITKYVVLVKVK